ncbi:LacI family DNA-binding transcriptional regulator [Aquimarina aggregata]|uniref:LacI family DNA-binding transcriptional regulator n=1 Tax=Aquimarina aggregata TaxID=1642818 RepID=UPI002493BD6B|nr:LacI family DNA-binding transcriptional regulator [Aquimarina aggregata]
MQATLQDIADKIGVSVSTVSRALKDNPRISALTKEKVRRAAKEVGYLTSIISTQQNQESSNLIGVIVPKINYYLYAMAISGIESIAEQHGMHIIVCQSNESDEREKKLVDKLIDIGVSGVIVSLASETKTFSHFEKLKHNGIPLVFFNRECNNIDTHKVAIDNHQAAYEGVQHLISVGCKKIAYLGGPKVLQINRDRIEGYKNALKESNISFDENLISYSKFDRESTLSAARRLLYSPDYPDGILAFSDQMAISVMLAAKERGIKIPEQLSIVGFNNEPVDKLLEPSLTSIDQPAYLMGIESARLLLQPSTDFKSFYEKKILKSTLVIRNSTNKNRLNKQYEV